MQTRPRHYIEVSVIHDSCKDTVSGNLQLTWTRIKVTRVTESGNHTYTLKFPETIVAIERSIRDCIEGLIHPEDRSIVQAEIARETAEVHPDKNSEQRKESQDFSSSQLIFIKHIRKI